MSTYIDLDKKPDPDFIVNTLNQMAAVLDIIAGRGNSEIDTTAWMIRDNLHRVKENFYLHLKQMGELSKEIKDLKKENKLLKMSDEDRKLFEKLAACGINSADDEMIEMARILDQAGNAKK